ncbi:sigma-54-dependent Fis family transcriptional regulator [Cryptosporangium japonicum]|uniref:Helix-turn-helix domain-containing protein n=1 Tax=Cryptosporangium japonicum TaxID=80872 RepID=A0ABN0UKV2_9ACTN
MTTDATAWEQFQSGLEPRDVRAEVLTSWRRSQFSGVDPEHAAVPYVETDVDSSFARVAVPVLTGMATHLVGHHSCLALSDAAGSVLWRWVSEPMLRSTLDDLRVVEGFNFGEEHVGTNGLGTALETGGIAMVRGAEHFVHRFHDVTCVAAPVRHPITRRTIGAVNVTCRAADTNALLPVIVGKLVEEIRQALYTAATARERELLAAFLASQRAGPGPVAVVGDDLVICSAQAAELGFDRLGLWDAIRTGAAPVLPADLRADVRLVRSDGTVAGAVVTVCEPAATPARPGRRRGSGRADAPRPATADAGPDVVRRVAELAAEGPVAVVGEPGCGKLTVLREVFGSALVLDAATYPLDPGAWLERLRSGGATVVRHAELWDLPAVRRVAAAVGERRRAALAFTVTLPAGSGSPAGSPAGVLLDAVGASEVPVPPLRRTPDAVVAAARAHLHGHDPRLTFTADALAALRRYSWPGNFAELRRVVRKAARDADGCRVGAADLPAEVRCARALTPLETAEAGVIAAVLRAHGGNKSTAARELGISRTALYAKLRAYRL